MLRQQPVYSEEAEMGNDDTIWSEFFL
jgi:hypothetical protein